MHKHLLLLALLPALSAGAYNVGTSISPKSVLIEEFTGIYCSNCPDGHKRAAAIAHSHPDDVFVMAVHAGSYATGRTPDFTTPAGTEIHDHFRPNAYPCGDISRRDFGEGIVMGRGKWYEAARTHYQDNSPVNLWSEASYDAATRTITVNVEAYFTSNMTDPRINVFLLQNNILGFQAGGNMGDLYPHRHMLRAMLTGSSAGDAMDVKTQGEYFTRTLTFTLPEAINGVATVPGDIEVLTFVTEGAYGEVMKASQAHLANTTPTPFVAAIEPPIAISTSYGLDYLEVYIDNYAAETYNEAKVEVSLNGDVRTLTYNGEIAPRKCSLIRVPLDGWWKEAYDNKVNTYSIEVKSVGNMEVNQVIAKRNFKSLPEWPSKLKLVIKTDNHAQDNRYRIINEQGEIIKQFGPYADGQVREYTEECELNANSVYGIEITDAWGDGINDPRGSVKIYNATSEGLVHQILEANDWGTRQFFRTADDGGKQEEPDNAIDNVDAANRTVMAVEYFDLSGRRIANPCCGIYVRKTVFTDGTSTTDKVTF